MSTRKRLKAKIKKTVLEFLVPLFILVILSITSLNIQTFLTPKKVLGVETNGNDFNESENIFWKDFLNKNPDYIPGWIEIGNLGKAREIDPNYDFGVNR